MNAKILTFIIAIACSAPAWADLVLIVNAQNPVDTLERKQVVDIFMGRSTAFPNQKPAQALDIGNSELRTNFYKTLTGKSVAQVDAYWATLVFAGRMSPPEKLANETAIINAVSNNPAAIGYVNRQTLPATVKVVMELPTTQ
ncbi:MAG: hypothetical protein EOO68_10855 [Moraxellaceae bacterium]|nr:MAG: hypothetical protein EOO68_10855 [Moraxellaceae bacterium]